ncbi:hypothetical protein [Kordia sp.]|uniref:hypothetical protein n=1 Tax=Kordia sp. TaxID=1965332 RepID=UPI003D2E1110
MSDQELFLNSKETMKELKISSCELMHLRQDGKIKFVKKGNAFLYDKKDIIKENNKK